MGALWISQCPGCSNEVVVMRKRAGECEGERMCAPCNRAALVARRTTRTSRKKSLRPPTSSATLQEP